MKLNRGEIDDHLKGEKEAAEKVRYELQERMECECDDSDISLDPCAIEKLLARIPNRELAELEPITLEDELALSEYARTLIKRHSL